MKCEDDGRCGYSPPARGRCTHRTDARYVLTLQGGKGKLEAFLPFGTCFEHSLILPRIVEAGDSIELCKIPGVLHAFEAYRDKYHEEPEGATLCMLGVETDLYQDYMRLAKASDYGNADAPVLTEHARAEDVKADIGSEAFEEAFGKGTK